MALTSLQSDIGARLSNAIDFKPDSRPYAPHLTIGRVKNRVPSRHLKQLSQGIQAAQPQIGQLARLEVTEIALMKSELSPTGAVYTQVKKSQLKNQA